MKVLVVLGHPNPGNSFNRAIAETVCAALRDMGHTALLRDLYAEGFDPTLPFGEEKQAIEELPEELQKEIAEVRECDGIVIVHPNWWGTPPALLKGWIDRVFRAGFAYSFTADGVKPGFAEKIAQVFSTSNTPRDIELNVYHDPLENFWGTVVFGLTGCKSFQRRNFEPIIVSDEAQRKAWLLEVEETIRRRFA
ncbi:MAG: NAD(P)H-dependent oxidoreductase [Thermoguttaceae bacterium]|nr:NAD(P)H-dependent oxidoreductase [Thermoguttaceae bacterium]